mmetsp:Transcript_799/g.1676  ORF Transcript_799/g.1676 Transcript_799/m.1676 type:complete len:228 (+) Transcript_799:395-1078(+)
MNHLKMRKKLPSDNKPWVCLNCSSVDIVTPGWCTSKTASLRRNDSLIWTDSSARLWRIRSCLGWLLPTQPVTGPGQKKWTWKWWRTWNSKISFLRGLSRLASCEVKVESARRGGQEGSGRIRVEMHRQVRRRTRMLTARPTPTPTPTSLPLTRTRMRTSPCHPRGRLSPRRRKLAGPLALNFQMATRGAPRRWTRIQRWTRTARMSCRAQRPTVRMIPPPGKRPKSP